MTPQQIFTLLGGPVVVLKIPRGQKKPILPGWQKLSLEDMTPEYLAGLNGENNIGVSLGQPSLRPPDLSL